jgi:MerR family redox-sensitive transcriptional activator SoxR
VGASVPSSASIGASIRAASNLLLHTTQRIRQGAGADRELLWARSAKLHCRDRATKRAEQSDSIWINGIWSWTCAPVLRIHLQRLRGLQPRIGSAPRSPPYHGRTFGGMGELMKIGDVAAEAGVSTRVLRYYEQQQLLTSTRTPAGHRQYERTAVEEVRLIQTFYGAGLSSKVIRELLPHVRAGEASPELLQLLETEHHRVEQRISDLLSVRNLLREVIDAAGHPRECLATPPS